MSRLVRQRIALRILLLALGRFAGHQAVAMVPSYVMCGFPARIRDGALPNLDDAVIGAEADSGCGLDPFQVRTGRVASSKILRRFWVTFR